MAKVSLYDLEYIVFDFETTGLDPHSGDDIIEIGAVQLKGTEPTGKTFQTLIDIGRPIPKQSTRVHGITNEDLKGKPTISEVFPDFLNFLGNTMLIAHNAAFDLSFIKKYLINFQVYSFSNPCIDTLQVSKQIFSYEKGHSLDAITKRFGIQKGDDRHRSIGDCLLTGKVFAEFLKTLKRRRLATLEGIRSCVIPPPKMRATHTQQSLNLF